MSRVSNKTQAIEKLKEMEKDGFLVSEWLKVENGFQRYWRITK